MNEESTCPVKYESKVKKLSHRKQKNKKSRGGDNFDTSSSDEEVLSSDKNIKTKCARGNKRPKKVLKVPTGDKDIKSPKNHKTENKRSKKIQYGRFDLLYQIGVMVISGWK